MSIHDEEYKNLLKNVENVPVSDRFLVEVNERIEADSFFKRMLRRIFFPLHIKIPLETFGVVVTAGLLLLVLQPYYTDMEIKKQLQSKREYAEEKDATPLFKEPAENKIVPKVKIEKSKPEKIARKKKTLSKVKKTVKQSKQAQTMKPEAAPKPSASVTANMQALVGKKDKDGERIKVSENEFQLPKSRNLESATFEKEAAFDNAVQGKKITRSNAAGAGTSADMDERAIKIDRIKELKKRKNKVSQEAVPMKPENSMEVHRIRLKTVRSKETKQWIENLITKYEGTFTRMTQDSYKVIMPENNLKPFKKDLQSLGTISEKNPYTIRPNRQSMVFELILTN